MRGLERVSLAAFCVVLTCACSSTDGRNGDTGNATATGGAPGAGGASTSGGFGDSGPAAWAFLRVDPRNLTTASDGTAVHVLATTFGAADISWLATGVDLQTLTDRQSIPYASATVPSVTGTAYDMTPSTPLAPAWYAIVIAPPDGGVQFEDKAAESNPPFVYRADGKYESLFRVGSAPMLLAVAACVSSSDALLPKLIFTFSEPVDIPAPPPFQVTVDGNVTDCVAYMVYGNTVGFTCSPAMPATAAINVSISAGIVATAGGGALRDAVGATTMTVDLPPAAPYISCRTWWETRTPTL